MADLTESAQWEAGIYQLETSDDVMGGAEGIDNLQAKQLGNRTLYLKDLLESLGSEVDELEGILAGIQLGADVGSVIAFPLSSAPQGYLKCNGATVSRTAYADLFALIGTLFGAGNGTTTFKLPDLRGEFIRGWDDGRGADSGRGLGSYQADEFESHSHNIYALTSRQDTWNEKLNTSGAKVAGEDTGSGTWYAGKIASNGGSETRPRNRALLFCIKY